MSEYKLNLSDNDAKRLIDGLQFLIDSPDPVLTDGQRFVAACAAEDLKEQAPLPTRHGAIVQTDHGTYILAEVHAKLGIPVLPWLELTHTGRRRVGPLSGG